MDTFAKSISDAIYGVGLLISKLDGLASKITSGGLGDLLIRLQPGGLGLRAALNIAGNARSSNAPDNKQGRASARIFGQQLRLENKLSQQKKKELALLDAKNKKQTEVDKLAEKFDVERIGLMKALGEATDAETKLRIQSKLAILDNNEALAKKLLAEMEGTKATVELTTQFYALSEAAKALITSFGVDPSQVGPGGTIIGGLGGRSNIASLANTSINNPAFASSGAGMDLGLALGFTPGSRTGGAAPTEVIVTVNTAAGGDRLSQAIAESIQIATRNGYSTVPAGQGF
jgi:hypothetical protein